MTLKSHAKFEEKLTCCLKNDVRNSANFHQSTRKSQNWDFDGILLFKAENAWTKNLQRSLKNDEKIEEELTICFKTRIKNLANFRGGSRYFEKKGRVLHIDHHGFQKKKILGSWPSKKAKTTLETISSWQNICISIFKLSPFLYSMKACLWNLINFSKFANALIRKEKSTYAAANEKGSTGKSWTLF